MKNIIIPGILFTIIDSIYLTSFKNFFNRLVKSIQGDEIKMNYQAAILCYISLIFGLYYFILKKKAPVLDAFLFGCVIYTVYETTNKAIFDKWSWEAVLLDSIWGGILFSSTTYLTYKFI